MPLGQGIGELWGAVRDRIEVSGHAPTWHVTAGSFDAALAFAEESYDDVVVVARRDRRRWWPRVTLTVTSDPALAASAPPLDELAAPAVPAQRGAQRDDPRDPAQPGSADGRGRKSKRGDYDMPLSLEAIFAHQEQLRSTELSEEAG